jgi:threonine/homoserine/homoserine lactone efflux protein
MLLRKLLRTFSVAFSDCLCNFTMLFDDTLEMFEWRYSVRRRKGERNASQSQTFRHQTLITYLFLALQLGGAAYLGYIGLRNLHAARSAVASTCSTPDSGAPPPTRSDLAAHDRFRQAFLISTTNPKSVLFLASVFPSFIDPVEPVLGQFAILFVTLTLVVSVVHLGFALMAQRISHLIGHARFNRHLKFASGIAFLGIALIVVGATFTK